MINLYSCSSRRYLGIFHQVNHTFSPLIRTRSWLFPEGTQCHCFMFVVEPGLSFAGHDGRPSIKPRRMYHISLISQTHVLPPIQAVHSSNKQGRRKQDTKSHIEDRITHSSSPSPPPPAPYSNQYPHQSSHPPPHKPPHYPPESNTAHVQSASSVPDRRVSGLCARSCPAGRGSLVGRLIGVCRRVFGRRRLGRGFSLSCGAALVDDMMRCMVIVLLTGHCQKENLLLTYGLRDMVR